MGLFQWGCFGLGLFHTVAYLKNNFPIFQGVLRQSTINDLPVGRSVEETLRLVKAFQFVEKHGEVCPANWQENAPTIKPDPEGSQE